MNESALKILTFLTIPLPVSRCSNKLEPKLPNNIPGNPSFCCFATFLIVSLRPFINKSNTSGD